MDNFLRTDIKGKISKAILKTEFSGALDADGAPTTHGKVTDSLILTFANDLDSVAKKVKHIESAREIADANALNQVEGKPARAFPFDYVLYALNEQYLHVSDNAIFAISMSVVAGFVVMLPLIVHPAAAVIVTVLLVLVEIELYGLLAPLGMKLNSVTVVNLISAIGIAVEFHTHIARAFMLAKGDRPARVVAALEEVGGPVMCGAVTDFLAVLAIAFSDFDYFVLYFFIQFTIIIVVCAANALVLLPIILSYIGPPEVNVDLDDGDATSEKNAVKTINVDSDSDKGSSS